MKIVKKHLTNGQYMTKMFEKTNIFIHHTAGTSASGALNWWNQTPQRIGTPYVIDRDGTIYEAFDPKMWAYHLGIKGDDNYMEMHSVNIELVSAGRLYKEDDGFIFYPLYPNKSARKIIPENEVFIMKSQFRGFKYFHNYTDEQIKALDELLGNIIHEFKIPFENDPEKICDFNDEIYKNHLKGIFAHSAVRKDKDDIFPHPEIIKNLKNLKNDFKQLKSNSQISEAKITGNKRKRRSSKNSSPAKQ